MARTVGSKNKNTNSAEFTKLFREHWGNNEKLDLVNAKLEEVIVDGGHRDALSAITLVLKYVALPMDKEVETDALVSQSMDKSEILAAIKGLQKD